MQNIDCMKRILVGLFLCIIVNPCLAQVSWQFEAGTGVHLQKIQANQDFHYYGMEIKARPMTHISTKIHFPLGLQSLYAGFSYDLLESTFFYGPVRTQPYSKTYIKDRVFIDYLYSFRTGVQRDIVEKKWGRFAAQGEALFSVSSLNLGSEVLPRELGIGAIYDGDIIQSQVIARYQRVADLGMNLGLLYYPPQLLRNWRYYSRISYTHFFRQWASFSPEYYRIYNPEDPAEQIGDIDYDGTTYNRHFSFTIGFERQFGKKRYSRDQPF